jgi:hypothetical protein
MFVVTVAEPVIAVPAVADAGTVALSVRDASPPGWMVPLALPLAMANAEPAMVIEYVTGMGPGFFTSKLFVAAAPPHPTRPKSTDVGMFPVAAASDAVSAVASWVVVPVSVFPPSNPGELESKLNVPESCPPAPPLLLLKQPGRRTMPPGTRADSRTKSFGFRIRHLPTKGCTRARYISLAEYTWRGARR